MADLPRAGDHGVRSTAGRLATETKQAFKTTEFWSFVVIVAAILISAAAATPRAPTSSSPATPGSTSRS